MSSREQNLARLRVAEKASGGGRLSRAVLLFFKGGEWTDQNRSEWELLTGSADATTKSLCDLARRVLKEASESE